jgi:hypothetical protein
MRAVGNAGIRTLLVAGTVIGTLIAPAGAQTAVNAHGAAIKAFRARLDTYVKLHNQVAGTVPALKETGDPTKLHDREVVLGKALQQARAGVNQGAIFGTDLGPFIRKTIRHDWRHRSAVDRKAVLKEVPRDPVHVNELYPTTVPLATFPPRLLQEMPPLPEDLEYRFYGRHLIIRDIDANLVVDILPDAIPGA